MSEVLVLRQPELVDEDNLGSSVADQYDEQKQRVDAELSQRLVVAFLGNVSSGKSSLVNAIFGAEMASVSPIAGWSKEVQIYPIPWSEQVVIADTPGLQDVNEVISEKTQQFKDEVDIFIFVLNGAVGCTESEQEAYQTLVATGRPTLAVLNKVDAVRGSEAQIQEFLDETRRQLGAPPEQFLSCAADPHPAVAPGPIGTDAISRWLFETAAASGRDLILAKALRDKRQAATAVIEMAVKQAAAAGAIPIPGSDYVLLTGVQVRMALKLAELYDTDVDRRVLTTIISQIVGRGGGRVLYRSALQIMKGAGWLGGPWGTAAVAAVAAAVAAAVTAGLGWALVAWFESNLELPLDQIAEVFRREAERFKEGQGGGLLQEPPGSEPDRDSS